MNDADFNNIKDPTKRRLALHDYLVKRGLASPSSVQLITPEVTASRVAMGFWEHIVKTVARPMLKALKQPNDYSPAGTQQLLYSSFRDKFNTMTKDELVILVSVMHAEELEKQCQSAAHAALIGDHTDFN